MTRAAALALAAVACGGAGEPAPVTVPAPGIRHARPAPASEPAPEPTASAVPAVEPVSPEVAAAAEAVRPEVVALLAPLSGPAAALGREVRDAARLAAAASPEVRLVVLDTRGTEEGARAAVGEAVFERGAAVLLGPIGQRESAAAAARAAELGAPIALLSPRAPAGGDAFSLWPSPAWEAEQAALAAVELGFDRLAVLAPDDEVGRAQADAFAAAARAAGVQVVADGRYDPAAKTLEADVKRFLGLDPADNARLRRHLRRHGRDGWKTFSPEVAFDLLYVPDGVERAALVVSYLPYFNVELRTGELVDQLSLRRKHGGRVPPIVQLLGSSGWNRPNLLSRGGDAVIGALVLDACPGGDEAEALSPAGAELAEAFAETVGRAPSRVARHAHDAARLVLSARAAAAEAVGRARAAGATGRSADLRRAIAAALAGARLADGACGPARVTAARRLEGEIVLYRVGRYGLELHAW